MIELIASGQGGLGKSTLTAALSRAMASKGKKAIAVDACAGLRDLDFHFQMENRIVYDWQDVMDGTCSIDQALLTVSEHVQLLAASQVQTWQAESYRRFDKMLESLSSKVDSVLIDAPGALSSIIVPLFHTTNRLLLLTAPYDSSIRKSEAILRRFRENGGKQAGLIVTMVKEKEVVQGLQYAPDIAAQVLDVPLLGVVPFMPDVEKALLKGEAAQGECYQRIALRLMGEDVPLPQYMQGNHSLLHKLFKGKE